MDKESIVLQLFLDIITFLGELDANTVISILASVVTVLVSGYLFGKVLDIKHRYMSESMEAVETICHDEGEKMISRGHKIADQRIDDLCEDNGKFCSEKAENVRAQKALLKEMVHNVFEEKTPLWVKGRFHRNGFHKKSPKALDKYKEKVGKKLYVRNLRIFEAKGINSHNLIAIKEAGLLYTEAEAIEAVGLMVDERLRLLKEQRVEIMKYLFLIRPIINLFRRDDD